jgi:hypothetical protein
VEMKRGEEGEIPDGGLVLDIWAECTRAADGGRSTLVKRDLLGSISGPPIGLRPLGWFAIRRSSGFL